MNLKQSLRSILRDRLNTSVIIISLAVGIACIDLIILFLNRELKTDKFQKNANRIFLVKCDNPFNKGTMLTICPKGAAEYMKENYPQVEDFCRIKKVNIQRTQANNQTFYNNSILYEASGNFFIFFLFNLITKNPNSVLESAGDIVISDILGKKYFGEELPVGRIITLIRGDTKKSYVIKGIFRKPLENTQFNFDMVSFSDEIEKYAYLLLRDKTDPSDLEKLLEKDKDKLPVILEEKYIHYHIKSLRETYYDTMEESPIGRIRDTSNLWVTIVIGLMIILVASFNYLGLINNKILEKSNDFSIRRIHGGSKVRLVLEFMLENLIIIIIAITLSLEIISWIMPLFNELTGSNLTLRHLFQIEGLLIMFCTILSLLLLVLMFSIGKISYLLSSSSYKTGLNSRGKIMQIPVFNIFQLAVALFLLVCAFSIIKQMNYIKNKDIGLDKNVLEVKLPFQYSDPSINSAEKAKIFKEEILRLPTVTNVSITMASPLLEYMTGLFRYKQAGEEKEYTPNIFKCDENFIPTLGIMLLDGRNFSGNPASDTNNCIINESLAKMFSSENLLGNRLPGHNNLTVIGLVKDFNYLSLKNVIAPCVLIYDNSGPHLLVKASKGQVKQVREVIKEEWLKLIPDYPVEIESINDRFEWYHRENSNFVKLIGSCCFISMFLSMIGLFAISYITSRKRTKEIGIRKINGATVTEVIKILNKDFISWVIVAFIIATPVGWYVMNKWLENYAYKTNLVWWIFVLAGIIAMGIALLTVSWQCWKAARRNPVEALRYE